MPPHRIPSRRSTAALVLSLVALFVALGGPAQAKRLLTGKDLKAGTITAREVKNHSLGTAELSKKAIRSLTTLKENAVTTKALAPGSVLTGTIADGQVTGPDLAASSVSADKVAPDAVGQREIRANGVGASEIADNSIDSGEIIDGSLTARDVATYVSAFTVDFDNLPAGKCQRAPVPVAVAGLDITGDLVVASPRTAWPAHVEYTVNGTATANGFAIWACNQDEVAVDPPATIFNYAVFGF